MITFAKNVEISHVQIYYDVVGGQSRLIRIHLGLCDPLLRNEIKLYSPAA